MKRLLVFLIPLMLLTACGEDDPVTSPPPPGFQNLTEKWHVLNNLERAYNHRNITRFDEILDVSFTFFFSDGDIGGEVPEQWGRAEEVSATSALFSPTPPVGKPRCKSIDVDVLFEGVTQWAGFTPPSAPDETWYTATVFYDFTIAIELPEDPDRAFLAVPGSKAQFTVRNAGAESAPRWQLVEWHDVGAPNFTTVRSAVNTEESSWGRVKVLYQ